MAIAFTEQQKKVLEARDHDVLVSAAAGSGKTAVLTHRILRMISEGENPLDIDRLLVVTFTNAAAAQMRDRISRAISEKLSEDPDNAHLQKQEVLIHNAKITTIDSFFMFLVRNNFAQIGIDPGFRQMDQTEADLMRSDALEDFLESQYDAADPDFLRCAEFFSPGRDDRMLEVILDELYKKAVSHPDPEQWLLQRTSDYAPAEREELFQMPWMQFMFRLMVSDIESLRTCYDHAIAICSRPDGPFMLSDFIASERDALLGGKTDYLTDAQHKLTELHISSIYDCIERIKRFNFPRFPSVRANTYPDMDPGLKDTVRVLRDKAKDLAKKMQNRYMYASPEMILAAAGTLHGPVSALAHLAVRYLAYYGEVKKEKGVIDFADLEHLALRILADKNKDGTYTPTAVCRAYRQYFAEVMIDEYQDSNEIQELLLQMISREDEGAHNRFMVGDVKQSIYKFRLARPEIFMDKYGSYLPDDPHTERIDLDANFRSRHEVIDSVNEVFMKIMRREIGGIDYTPEVSLKAKASYPEADDDRYQTELILAGGSDGSDEAEDDDLLRQTMQREMNSRQKEALAAAQEIRRIVGKLPITDDSGMVRPCRYSDICILLRSGAGWFEDFRKVFEEEGIPVYVQSRTGYFAAKEIRSVIDLLRVLDNPRQDIPLYGVMRGYWGAFTEEEFADLAANADDRGALLYDKVAERAGAVETGSVHGDAAETSHRDALSIKCRQFLSFIDQWRRKTQYMQVHTLLSEILEETGYENYCRALPGGAQRFANLSLLQSQAASFDAMALQGLFDFIRYIDQLKKREIDYGEASILDENADVVRLMSIHKSKGLEFPVCIVSGLAKEYSFRRKDASGSFLCENDWGIGTDIYDSERHLRYASFRKEAVAAKIRTDSLGEELRVLYVAMTRAKEKLILTGYLKNMDKKLNEWKQSAQAYTDQKAGGDGRLPVNLIAGSESFLHLIMLADAANDSCRTIMKKRVDESSMLGGILSDQEDMGRRKEQIMAAAQRNGGPLPLPSVQALLQERMSRRYAWDDLQGLYTKTTVSELKMAALQEEGEESASLFPEKVLTPVIPAFVSEAESPEVSGASYGTAVHRILELFDYERFPVPSEVTEDELRELLMREAADGRVPQSYAQSLYLGGVLKFLRSPLAGRMADAHRRGRLYREQPFVLGIPASELDSVFPQKEWVLIQGIIDAFFEENGELILVDYKTDRVREPEELIRRYRTQIEYYTRALKQITGKTVRQRILYSTALGTAVLLST